MPPTAEHSLPRGNIMIVDDNPTNLELLGEMLQLQQYAVRSLTTGRAALNAALREPPDLILLDINMPEMNGYEVCERVKANPQLSGIPVIFISGRDRRQGEGISFGGCRLHLQAHSVRRSTSTC
jgi:CheY-like chemotaxis protein